MATPVQSLFGITPEALQAQRMSDLDAQALQFARLTPMQQAQMGLFRGASQLGTGLAGLMGYEDPEMKRIKARQGMLGGIDMTDPLALRSAAQQAQQSGDFAAAQELVNRANELELNMAQVGREQALASKANVESTRLVNEQQREEQLRAALAELPENATPEQYLSIVRRFGSPDKVMTSIQTSMDKEEQRKQALELKKLEIEGRLELARQQGADRLMIAQMQIEARRELAQFAASLKASQQPQKPERPLPASLQKAEDADYEAIESVTGLNMSLDPVIKALGGFGDKPADIQLNLSAANNAMNTMRNFFGQSTPESRAYAQLEETKIRIINDSLRLNKGTQTEGDAQRAAREVEAAWAKNDTEATRQALLRLYQINERAKQNKEKQIERRRRSQGVSTGPAMGTAENPIKLD